MATTYPPLRQLLHAPLLRDVSIEEEVPSPRFHQSHTAYTQTSAVAAKVVALACACALGVGSHFGQYIVPPISGKLASELGASNTEISLLIAAYGINSTWTPLIGGLLASRYGTSLTSVLATCFVFSGLSILLLGDILENLQLMTFGMFVFGLGMSPLSVCIESIVFRFFRNDRWVGMFMAIGLVAGKFASFLGARISYPLANQYGRHAPFIAAVGLSFASMVINFWYLRISPWLVQQLGVEEENSIVERSSRSRGAESVDDSPAKHSTSHAVRIQDVYDRDLRFWGYLVLNALCGAIYIPFPSLASTVFKHRYKLDDSTSSTDASYLLAGNVLLYPICGFVIDALRPKNSNIVPQLFVISSSLTLFCFIWLALPTQITTTPLPGALSFSIGLGFAPLLLVVIVPNVVPEKYTSTALGFHKSLEYSGNTIFQTLAGLLLDVRKEDDGPGGSKAWQVQTLVNAFFLFNIAHLVWITGLGQLIRTYQRRTSTADGRPSLEEYEILPTDEQATTTEGSLEESVGTSQHSNARASATRRGKRFAAIAASFIVSAWVIFLATAAFRLRNHSKH